MTDLFKVDLTAPNFSALLTELGATGSLFYAPLKTDLPKGMEAYKDPWVNLGWFSDDGLTEATSEENADFKPWQASSPIRGAITSQEFTFTGTLWSLGGLANAMRYGVPAESMRWDDAEKFAEFEQGGVLPEDFKFRLGVDVMDGEKHRRFLLPAASISARSDNTYKVGELTGYELTWKANLDSELGYSILRRFKEGWKPGTAGSLLDADGAKAHDLGKWHTPVEGDGGESSDDGDAPEEETPVSYSFRVVADDKPAPAVADVARLSLDQAATLKYADSKLSGDARGVLLRAEPVVSLTGATSVGDVWNDAGVSSVLKNITHAQGSHLEENKATVDKIAAEITEKGVLDV